MHRRGAQHGPTLNMARTPLAIPLRKNAFITGSREIGTVVALGIAYRSLEIPESR